MTRSLILAVLALTPALAQSNDAISSFGANAPYRYTHPDPAFTIEYPWDWVTNDPAPPVVHDVGSPDLLPSVRLMVLDEPWWLPLRFAGRAATTQLSRLGRDLNHLGSEMVEVEGLPMELTEIRWTINVGPGVDLHTLLASSFIDDRWVIVMVSTGQHASHRGGLAADESEPFPEVLRDIALSVRPASAPAEASNSH